MDRQYAIALDIAATQVLTIGELGSKFTFTAGGSMFEIYRPTQLDFVELANGDYSQHFDFVQASNGAAGNIRVCIKSPGGSDVMKTDNGLEITADKAKAPFYIIRAEQSALGQAAAQSYRG